MAELDDFLSDSAALFGETQADDDKIQYGPLVLTPAPKEGKANTLLADHLFSPSLLLAELLERGIISFANQRVIELGAGCALPSLLSSTLSGRSPCLSVITDYPDETIMKNLSSNIERNRSHFDSECTVHVCGYEWGCDVAPLLDIAEKHGPKDRAFDIVVMSDLLHFDGSHNVLLKSLLSLLRRHPSARAYVAAGKYTLPHVCEHFVSEAAKAGITLEEQEVEAVWKGVLSVSGGGLDREQLGARKGMSRWWIGRWTDP
ncbi:hypothetical protein GY45DRAFT_1432824 [Cubamyces sp. BRFM 1775]|nr:hypothetical protein GY45DRAFT_1432824 [Cubamyces sp. BRFM 1775]